MILKDKMLSVHQWLTLMTFLIIGTQGFGMESVHLLLKWKHQFQFAGYYAAVKEGYYAKEGLHVHIIEPDTEKPRLAPLLSGQVEFAVAGSEVIPLRQQGSPILVLASIFQHTPHIFLTLKDRGINSLNDLSGKKIMIDKETSDLFALLDLAGISQESIQTVEHSFSIQPLIDGSVDVISAYSTNEPFLLAQAGYQSIEFSPQRTGVDFYGDNIITTEAYQIENPQIVAGFTRASLKGWYYAIENKEELIDWMLAHYPVQKSREAIEYEAQATIPLLANDFVKIGHINPKRWEIIAANFRKVGLIDDTEFVVEDMLYQPSPHHLNTTLLKVLVAATILCVLLLLFTFNQRSQQQRLRKEITRRVAIEATLARSEKEYRDFFEHAPLAFIVWDLDLKVKDWNHSAEAIFGWSKPEVLGKSAFDFLVSPRAEKDVEVAKKILRKGNIHTLVNENLRKDGQQVWCRWYNVPRKNAQGEVYESQSIAQDISLDLAERKDLEQKARRILQSNHAKDEIIAQTSHEIRNPLNAILGYAEILNSDSDDPETKEMTAHIISGTESMLRLLNDLLDASKMQAGKMDLNLEVVDLGQLVRQRCEFYRTVIERHALELEIQIPEQACNLITDQQRVGQIITNLLSNAAKFTEVGKITVCVQQFSTAEPFAYRIDVIDTGIGMSAKSCQRIFTAYTQADNKISSKYGGSGLGLSLSHKLATILEGELTVESELGQGSRFSLFLKSKTHS